MRARTHAERFPRPYWILLTGEAIQSIGYGMIVPFISIYLTDRSASRQPAPVRFSRRSGS
jgi:hypothetical protein